MEKDLWYQRDDKTQNITKYTKIKLQMWRCVDTLFFKPSLNIFSFWRIFLLKLFGAKIGKGCYISPLARIYMPWNLTMGSFSSIDDYVFIKDIEKVTIGDYVSISNFVHIITGGHDVRQRNFASLQIPIIIENGAFIGADSYISKGVIIGQMAVIGEKSFVLKNVPENTIAFGNPCQIKNERLSETEYKKYRYNYIKSSNGRN
ncbi:acetyltransferase CysE/LacA/LpxA/NodL family [Bacteroides sp. CAG:875]|nr:acetyltransferase CysE/LacA/LpxA/NodL family [Bacteroides sp. CAG:875]